MYGELQCSCYVLPSVALGGVLPKTCAEWCTAAEELWADPKQNGPWCPRQVALVFRAEKSEVSFVGHQW
jgi:hypothetical protein